MGASKGTANQKQLLAMVRALMEGERLDRYEAAKRFGGTPQTAHRRLSRLAAELPIKVLDVDGCRSYEFDRARFEGPPSLAEALAASFAASLAPTFRGTPYEGQLIEIRERTVRKLAGSRRSHFRNINRKIVVLATQAAAIDARHEELEEVLDGVLRQHVLAVRYRRFGGKVETLKLKPYSIIISGGILYVIAPDKEGELHPFRFDRLETIDATPQTFEYPSEGEYDPSVLFRNSLGVFVNHPIQQVCVGLAGRWRAFLRTHRWHSSQTTTEMPDGRIQVHFLIRVCPEFERWVLAFGDEAEVIAPPDLREKIARQAEGLVRRYRQG